jgi:hypothetical protein
MPDEVEEKQVKNLRNKVRDFINKTTPESLIRVAVFCRLPVPKPLILKYLSQTGQKKPSST